MPTASRLFKATIFQALSHPTRVAIVETLRDGEMSAGVIIERLRLEQANASQHFSVLRSKHIVTARKAGNQVFYSLREPRLMEIMELLNRYFQTHVEEAMAMLHEIELERKEEIGIK